jgi:hypothetical protein
MVSIKELKENPSKALRELYKTAIIPNDVLRFAILQNKRHRTIQNKPLLFKYEAQTYKQDTITRTMSPSQLYQLDSKTWAAEFTPEQINLITSLEKEAPKNEVQQLIYPSVTIDEIYDVKRKYLTF